MTDPFDPHHHVHATDPLTSLEAAVSLDMSDECHRVLQAYRDYEAITDYEAYRRVGRIDWESRTHQRCSDLRNKLEVIWWTGEVGITPTGRRAGLCRLTFKGWCYLYGSELGFPGAADDYLQMAALADKLDEEPAKDQAMANGWIWDPPTTNRKGETIWRGHHPRLEILIQRSGNNSRYMSATLWPAGQRIKTDDRYLRDADGVEHFPNIEAVKEYVESTSIDDLWSRSKEAPNQQPVDEPKDPVRIKFIDGVSPKERQTTKRGNGHDRQYLQRGCDICPLQETWPSLKSPRMPLRGTPDADILILGEAPGREEAQRGLRMSERAGMLAELNFSFTAANPRDDGSTRVSSRMRPFVTRSMWRLTASSSA